MSIGIEKKEIDFQPGILNRTGSFTKKITSSFFENPVHYLFYLSLLGLIIALFFDTKINWQIYFVLLFLGIIKLYNFVIKNDDGK